MAKLPTVAIIGRPNTGKSTLFNRLVGSRRAIVSTVPGTTRDLVAERIEGEKLSYLLIDTGGIGGGTEDRDFEDDVEAQAVIALSHADLILFIVNGREEITAADHAVVDALRKKRRRHVAVFLVVSKCDDPQKSEESILKFHELGIADEMFAVSSPHGLGIDVLTNAMEKQLAEMHFAQETVDTSIGTDVPRVALVGRPNVGKSSLMNALLPESRRTLESRMTGPEPGTTRDTMDVRLRSEGKEYLFLDTAGLRHGQRNQGDHGFGRQAGLRHGRKNLGEKDFSRQSDHKRQEQLVGEIEVFATLRTLRAIDEADVTVLVLDATEKISRQDQRIAAMAIERGTGLILLMNKTDLLSKAERHALTPALQEAFPFCRWAPVLFTSAVTRENLPKLFSLVTAVCGNRARRIETAVLNRWFQDTVASFQPKGIGGKSGKAKYVTQTESAPPTFVLFLNDPKKLHFSTLRFFENKLRSTFSFEGTPIRWVKKRGRADD